MMYKVQGMLGTKSKLAKHFGIKVSTVYIRINSGMSVEQALKSKIVLEDTYTLGNSTYIIKELSSLYGTGFQL